MAFNRSTNNICSDTFCRIDHKYLAQTMLEASEFDLEKAIEIYHMGKNYFATYYPSHYAKYGNHGQTVADATEGIFSVNEFIT